MLLHQLLLRDKRPNGGNLLSSMTPCPMGELLVRPIHHSKVRGQTAQDEERRGVGKVKPKHRDQSHTGLF